MLSFLPHSFKSSCTLKISTVFLDFLFIFFILEAIVASHQLLFLLFNLYFIFFILFLLDTFIGFLDFLFFFFFIEWNRSFSSHILFIAQLFLEMLSCLLPSFKSSSLKISTVHHPLDFLLLFFFYHFIFLFLACFIYIYFYFIPSYISHNFCFHGEPCIPAGSPVSCLCHLGGFICTTLS